MFSKQKLAEYRKGVAAVVGVIAQGVALGLFHGAALTVATVIVSAATAVGVIRVENERKAT